MTKKKEISLNSEALTLLNFLNSLEYIVTDSVKVEPLKDSSDQVLITLRTTNDELFQSKENFDLKDLNKIIEDSSMFNVITTLNLEHIA